jgi:hypothetical protein
MLALAQAGSFMGRWQMEDSEMLGYTFFLYGVAKV